MTRYGMIVDLRRCVGCQTCTAACKYEKALPHNVFLNRTVDYETGEYPNVRRTFLPILCMHCETAPCEKICPTNSTKKRDDGIVWVDYEECAGCRLCMAACPYGVRIFFNGAEQFYGKGDTPLDRRVKERYPPEVVLKCDFCRERVDKGIEKGLSPGIDPEATPVCVISCVTEARKFGDLDDPNSEVSKLIRERKGFQLHPHHGTNPAVYYVI